MSNSYFRFRQFTVNQDLCGMKVGTDGTLLGAWAAVPDANAPGTVADATRRVPTARLIRILDIGTGTGLIALMMAQRFPGATVVGVDIDDSAVSQARDNAAQSPFAARVTILQCDIRLVTCAATEPQPSDDILQARAFDAIVCNPPYYVDSLVCPDRQRTLARHCSTLGYRELMGCASRLLADNGELSVVIPFECKDGLEGEATLAGLSKVRECAVKTTVHKPPRRYMLAFRRHPAQIERTELVIGSEKYNELTKDFYL